MNATREERDEVTAEGDAVVKKTCRTAPASDAVESANAIALAVGAAIAESVEQPSARLRRLMKMASAG